MVSGYITLQHYKFEMEGVLKMYAVLFIAMAISGLTVAAGFYVYLKKDKTSIKRIRKLVKG